jgi:hypothetical protein
MSEAGEGGASVGVAGGQAWAGQAWPGQAWPGQADQRLAVLVWQSSQTKWPRVAGTTYQRGTCSWLENGNGPIGKSATVVFVGKGSAE